MTNKMTMIAKDGRDGEMQGEMQYLMVSMMIRERLAESAEARRGAAGGPVDRGRPPLAGLRRLLYGAPVARVDAACPTPRHAGAVR
jgi:hypothetical protein